MKKTIKVGVLLDGLSIAAWQLRMLEQLQSSDYASIDTLILSKAGSSSGQPGQRRQLLYDAFVRRESRMHKAAPDACEIEQVPGSIAAHRFVLGTHSRTSQAAEDNDAATQLTSRQLDIVLLLGSYSNLAAVAGVAKYGVWYFEHSFRGTSCPTGSSVGFWEVLLRRPFIYASLNVRLPHDTQARVVCDTFSAVHHLSHFKSRNEHLWKILSFVPRSVRCIYESGAARFLEQTRELPPSSVGKDGAAHASLKNLEVSAPMAGYTLWRLFQKVMRKLYLQRWILMYSPASGSRDFGTYQKLLPPAGRFWADPYVVRRNGSYFIFMEDASLQSWQGHISVLRMNDAGEWSRPEKVIERPYHMSYPFLLEWQGELYLIPETGENRTVEVYRCRHFPADWEFSHNLMEGVAAYDATLLEHNGTWWMFATVKEQEGASSWDELCIFYADDPLSTNWQPHPENPVVSDVRRARPAGPLFRSNERLYRPSQNSSYRYGYGLNFNEIVELTVTRYREETVEFAEPTWDRRIRGLHTYCTVDGMSVIDAIHRARRFRLFR